jgi:hypothetical protein
MRWILGAGFALVLATAAPALPRIVDGTYDFWGCLSETETSCTIVVVGEVEVIDGVFVPEPALRLAVGMRLDQSRGWHRPAGNPG